MTVEEWLGTGNPLSLDIWHKKYRHGGEDFEEWLGRVSGHDEEVARLIREKKFLFAGRVLANRGTTDGSWANCYTKGRLGDSVEDMMQAAKDIALTFKAHGGQGMSFSGVRPKGAPVRHVYESDGIMPFMEIMNTVTGAIAQGNHSRRGALMMSLDIWHREAPDFITVKSDLKRLNNANLSVEIDDDFMRCVEKYYKTGERITRHIRREYEGGVMEYDVVPIDLWKLLCEQACKYAEPGILFMDRIRNYNLMQHHPEYRIESTNPYEHAALRGNPHVKIPETAGNPLRALRYSMAGNGGCERLKRRALGQSATKHTKVWRLRDYNREALRGHGIVRKLRLRW